MTEAKRPRHSPLATEAADVAALRSDLADWTVDAVQDAIGAVAAGALGREQILPALRALEGSGNPIAVLTRCFMLGAPVTPADLDRALPSLGAAGAWRIGLVAAGGMAGDDALAATVDLRPYAAADGERETTWWVASDHGEAVTGARLAPDHVLGIGGASTTLASLTMRAPVGRVLDLGTGCGIQALHASSHARQVVATDISRRALGFAAFNGALNRPAAAWELREGSMLEPVAGEAFDLVVSNPPFVITPAGAPSFEYRDGGAGGDGIVASLVTRVGEVLAPGGVAQLLGNWEVPAGAEWTERIESWLDASAVPLDAWVIQRDLLDPAEYAETWLRDAGITPDRDPQGFAAAYRSYLDDFDARGVAGIGLGMITLRRPTGAPTLRRLEEHEGQLPAPIGPHIAAALAAHDWLAAADDDAVFAAHWRVAGDVTTESYAMPGAADPMHILLRQGGAFGRSVRADTALAGFVGACDGELSAGQIAGALASLLEVPAATMLAGLAPAIRALALDGLVLRD